MSALEIPAGSDVSTALTTMNSSMAKYNVGDIRFSALQLNNDWINILNTTSTNPYKLANNVYDPTKHPQLFNALCGSVLGTQYIIYTTSKIITSAEALNFCMKTGVYYKPKVFYLNNNKLLLYYDTSSSLWRIRKYKIETSITDLDPTNSSNYVEYTIPDSSTCATACGMYTTYLNDSNPFLSYVNGIYFLKLFECSSSVYTYFFKYSYDLQTWYDYSENGSTCGSSAMGWTEKELPEYCNGYYYYVAPSGTNLIIYYKTSLTAAYTTATLNVPANGYIMSPIYYVNGKYYMLVGYGVNGVDIHRTHKRTCDL